MTVASSIWSMVGDGRATCRERDTDTWRCRSRGYAEPGFIVLRQSTVSFTRISCSSLCSRCPHLEIFCIISFWPRIWQSRVRCLGVAFGVRELDSSGGAVILSVQCLARQWIHVLHQCLVLDEFHIFSTLPSTRILLRGLRSHAEWRSVLSRCFSLLCCSRHRCRVLPRESDSRVFRHDAQLIVGSCGHTH